MKHIYIYSPLGRSWYYKGSGEGREVTMVLGYLLPTRPWPDFGAVFRLHYFTTRILLYFILFIVIRVSVGQRPIYCTHGEHMTDGDIVDAYCWMRAFTLPKYHYSSDLRHEKTSYYPYYSWIPTIFLLQLVMFCIPYQLWRMWEGDILVSQLRDMGNLLDKSIVGVATYITRSSHRHYMLQLYMWELLIVINSSFHVWLMDRFFGGTFFRHGAKTLLFVEVDQELRNDLMITVFPRVTMCSFKIHGLIEEHDVVCILPFNTMNERMCVLLWFWLLVSVAVSVVTLICRSCILHVPSVRSRYFGADLSGCRSLRTGNYLLLYLLKENTDSSLFRLLIESLQEKEEVETKKWKMY